MKRKLTSEERREWLFDLYSGNLSALFPKQVDIFVCPLCIKSFTREDLSAKLLSEEHIIPSGNLTTLTCQKCNNETGSALDSHLLKRIQFEENMAISGGPVRTKIRVGQGEQNTNMYLSLEDGKPCIKLVGLPDQSNPRLQEKLIKEWQSGTVDMNLDYKFGYDHIRSRVALLRSAYLMMFRQFGYAYILSKGIELVRKKIQDPSTETSISGGMIFLKEPISQSTVTLLSEPKHLRCFFVLLKLSRKIDYNVGIALPGETQASTEFYKKWADQTGPVKFTLSHMPYSPEFISDKKYVFAAQHIWRSFIQS